MIFCITNSVPDLRSCTVAGRHRDGCSGIAMRWETDISVSPMYADRAPAPGWVPVTRSVMNQATGKFDRVTVPCPGCLPRKAEHGLLCWSCWEKTDEALKLAVDMITHLRSVERAQQLDNAGVRSSQLWAIPVPVSWRMADELLMLLGENSQGFPSTADVDEVLEIATEAVNSIDPDMWVARPNGAEDAVRFYLQVQAAMAQHPMAEYEHRVRNVRCYKCKQRTLVWKPALMFEGEVHVTCTNPKCGAELDQTLYERVALLEDPRSRWAKKKSEPAESEQNA